MKVLQINSVCGVLSTGRICTDIAQLLAREGHGCKIAYGRETVPEVYQKYAFRVGNQLDVGLHVLGTRLFDGTGRYSRRATKRLIAEIKAYDPDVIHLHNLHGYYLHLEALFTYLAGCGKPVVWTLHDCWAFTGHCAHFELAGCNKWQNGCEKCPLKGSYPTSLLWDGSKRNYALKKRLFTALPNLTLAVASAWLATLVKQSFFKDTPVAIIPNGIDLTQFRPTESDWRARLGVEDKILLLGVASTWSARKGLGDFAALAARLGERYRILLVGVTAKQAKALPKSILTLERTDSVAELAALYSAADLFVNPTYQDTYPTVNLEAQACGTPVITYQTGGSPESVDALAGAVVPKGDVEALARAIESHIPAIPLGTERFDKNKCYAAYLSLYREVTKQ